MSAGYRDSLLALGPKAFYSFDNDSLVDPLSRELLSNTITDDSSNGNFGTMTVIDEQGGGQSFGYAAGMLSLVEREQYPQQAICFGWKGRNYWSNLDQAHFPFVPYPKAFATLPYTLANFDKTDGSKQPGSFSVVFHIMKDQMEQDPGGLIATSPPGVSDSQFKPILSWDGILYVYFLEASFSNSWQQLCITFAPGTGFFDKYVNLTGTRKNPSGDPAAIASNLPLTEGDSTSIGAINYRKNPKQVVITFKAGTTGKKGVFTVYVDGECMFMHKIENFNTSQIMHNWKNSPWYIGAVPYVWTLNDIPYIKNLESTIPGGRNGSYGTYDAPNDYIDRATTGIHIDQVAIYDYALNRPQVGYLYMKTRTYFETVLRGEPSTHLPLDEQDFAEVTAAKSYRDPNTLQPRSSAFNFNITGAVKKGFAGPSNIQNSKAYQFSGGSLVGSADLSTRDFSVELWAKISPSFSDRGIIFTQAGSVYPYVGGATLQLNYRNDVLTPGALQFNIDVTNQISSRSGVSVTDNLWHHIVVVRNKKAISIWIDGKKQGATNNCIWDSNTNHTYNQMHLMCHPEGILATQGFLSNFTIYQYALPSWQIKYHYYYNVLYRIRGTTLESGGSEETDVRLLNHTDGSLVQRVITDATTGSFEFNPLISTYYNVFAIDSLFTTPHARAFGPMVPTSYSDTLPYRRINDTDYFNPGSDGHGSA
jgi:hypothetical protein